MTPGSERKSARGSTGSTEGKLILITWLAIAAGVGDALAVADSLLLAPPLVLVEADALGDGVEVPGGIIESLAGAV